MPIPPQLWKYNDDKVSNKLEPATVSADVVLINDSPKPEAAIPKTPGSIIQGDVCHEKI